MFVKKALNLYYWRTTLFSYSVANYRHYQPSAGACAAAL